MGYLEDKYGGGRTKVWYNKDPDCILGYYGFGDFPEKCKINPNNLDKTHALVGSVPSQDLEMVWMMMQGEVWSPNGEANDFIREIGASHTSMSVGDIVELPDGTLHMVSIMGFKPLGLAFPHRRKR